MGHTRMTTDTGRTHGGLGRGLASLIPTATGTGTREIEISRIVANPYQPRGQFQEEELATLAASIVQHGVIQPILVTEAADGYQLIAGERRLRASVLAGNRTIPAIVRTADEQSQLSLALVENLQRSDLNPLDEARAFRQLVDEFGLTQEQVAQRVGRSRAAVTNTMRLLTVAPEVQEAVRSGRITEGHARALAALDDHSQQQQALLMVERRGLSVRQTERLVKDGIGVPEPTTEPAVATDGDADLEHMAARLRDALGTRVTLTPGKRGGRITITWFEADDLMRLYERLAGGER